MDIRFIRAINIIVILFASWLIARTVNNGVESHFQDQMKEKNEMSSLEKQRLKPPSLKSKNVKTEYAAIQNRNIFDSSKAEVESTAEVKVKETESTGPLVKSKIDAKVVGTFVMSNPLLSVASIEFKNETDAYQIKDSLSNATIVAIRRNRVEFDRNGQREYLLLNESDEDEEDSQKSTISPPSSISSKPKVGGDKYSDGIIKKSETEFDISREKLEMALNDSSILNQARAIPYIVDGKTQGFKIVAIRPRSIYRQLGIRNGDIIESVNGSELASIEAVLALMGTLRAENNFSLNIKRRGKQKTFSYDVK